MGPYTAHQHVVHLQHAHQHPQPQHPHVQVAAAPHGTSDVQWIVGWVRDILVIAMSLANLLHLASR